MVTIRKIIGISLVVVSLVFAETKFELSSSVSQAKIYKNQSTTLTLSISGSDKDLYKDIIQPDLTNMFSIISTSQSSSFSYINGKVSRNKEYRYVLQPVKPGIFIIDPFKIDYEGSSYSTKPLRVVVRNSNAKSTPSTSNQVTQSSPPVQPNQTPPASASTQSTQRNQPATNVSPRRTPRTTSSIQRRVTPPPPRKQLKNIFLEADISTNNIYIGESFDYSVKLYRRIRLWSSISIEQNDIQNVWQETFETSPEKVVRKNGARYYELEVSKKTIRPLSDGVLEIPPLISRFIVDPFSGEKQLATDVVTVNVMKLPEPIPSSYTGAIGTFEMDVSEPILNKESNSLQIQVVISGDGNIQAISAPIIQDTKEYRVLSAPKNEDVKNKQVFDYVIIPKVTGEIEIPPIEFSYFSKEESAYQSVSSKPIIFNATLDSMNPTKTSFNVQDDIQFLATNSIYDNGISILNNTFIVIGLIFINLGLTLFLIVKLLSKKFKSPFKGKFKNKRKLIQNIQQLSENNSITEMELLLIDVLNYFTDYDQNSIHPKEVEGSLIKADLSDPIVKSTMQWIKNTELIRFSNEKDNDSNHSNSDSLKRILKHIILEKEKK